MVLWLCCRPLVGAEANQTSDVVAGDSTAEVKAKLGDPTGVLEQGGRMTYLYDRGMVDFVSGRVVRADLVTAKQAAEAKQARERAEEEQRRQAEIERQRLTTAGQKELASTLSDAQFAKRRPSERLAFWEDFSRRYPYTDVRVYADKARADMDAGQVQRDRQEELGALQVRAREIRDRFKQLDADYAASLANWKRNEIDAERTTLINELVAAQDRMAELQGLAGTNEPVRSATDSGKTGAGGSP
jgi:hypothetical protein